MLDETNDFEFQRTIKKLSCKDDKWIAHGTGEDNREVCEEWSHAKMDRDDVPLMPLQFLNTIKKMGAPTD